MGDGFAEGNYNAMAHLEQKAQLELWKENEKNSLEVQKKQIIEDISSASHVQRAKELADVASKKELQRTIISFSPDNDVILQKECFGGNIKGKLPIKILSSKMYVHEEGKGRVLAIVMQKISGEICHLFWDVKKNEPRRIRALFEESGISFGYGEKKEQEIRRKLLLALMNGVETIILPERHGWYKRNGNWEYAFPDELTWVEVNQRC